VYREMRIEQVGEPNSIRFGHQTQQVHVAIERPRPSLLDHFERRFFGPEYEPVAHPHHRVFERDPDRLVAEPLDLHDLDEPAGRGWHPL
jgi:hypothetical protein